MIYFLYEKKYALFNPKSHDIVLEHMKNDPIVKILEISQEEIIKFIEENHRDSSAIIVFYYQHHTPFLIGVIDYINTYKTIDCKIVFFTFDFWIRGQPLYNAYLTKVLETKNHYAITFARDIEHLNIFHNTMYSPARIRFMNLWSVNKTSVIDFNNNPIKKILLSGALSNKAYPEREILKELKSPHIEVYEYNNNDTGTVNNNYNLILNKYIACFYSSVHVKAKNPPRVNTHIILLKLFEILGSGSLLIIPNTEVEYISKLGLTNSIHYYSCDMNKFNETVEYIMNDDNLCKINEIRSLGQSFAINNLNSFNKYLEVKNLITNIDK